MAQMLEVYAYGGSDEGRPGAGVTGAVEELLEMTGSLFLLWTVLSLYRRLNQAQASAPARVKVVPGAPRRDHETV
jgi:hypothetical protein